MPNSYEEIHAHCLMNFERIHARLDDLTKEQQEIRIWQAEVVGAGKMGKWFWAAALVAIGAVVQIIMWVIEHWPRK